MAAGGRHVLPTPALFAADVKLQELVSTAGNFGFYHGLCRLPKVRDAAPRAHASLARSAVV